MAAGERPILVVSNRLPFTMHRGARGLERRPSSGGLVSALDPVLTSCAGTWVGWPGVKLQPGESIEAPGDPYPLVPVELSTNEVNRYYHGFSNRTLWPLFHCFPERTRFERRDWEVYDAVNARFAAAAADHGEGAELIWFQDYLLMRAPLHLRRQRPDARIGFFLHIPFPPFDVFRLLPWNREILQGLLAADLIAFHVRNYAANFLDCVRRVLPARVDLASGLVEQGERTVQVGAFPLGIDFDRFEILARAARREPMPARQRRVLGVDRLDYTKGIPERIRAFERMLELHREHHERVVLLQLAVPSRHLVAEYQELKREIDELVGRVNGRFGTATWSPIHYLYRSIPQERLAGLYRDAHVALVTPLRDGMNLVAKEFAACQVDEAGVLVLSLLAGAAETMREAIHVNPYNVDGVAEALHRALTMDEAERRTRIDALRRRERANDLYRWLDDFLRASRTPGKLAPATERDYQAWLGRFLSRHRLALFLDYDGTLTPLVRHPSEARLTPEMQGALSACVARDDTDVAIVSGRALDDVAKRVPVPGLVFAGNHGLEIAGADLVPFRHDDLTHYRDRLTELAPQLRQIDGGGAWVEEKGASLTFHFREAEPSQHERLAEEARALIQAAGFQARDASCAVEARPPIGWDKGHAVLHVLRARYGPAWSELVRPVYVGDDDTDEDAFRVLSGLGITFRVGSTDRPTLATRSLSNVKGVQGLLEWLAGR